MTDLHGWMGTPDAFRSVQQANVFAAAGAAAAFMLYRKPFKPDAAIALVLPAFAAALLANPSEPSMLPFSKLAIMTGYLLYWSIAWVFVVREHARLRLGGPPVLALASGAMLVFAQTGRMAASIVLRGEEVDTTILSISSLMLFWLLVLLAIGTYWTSRNRAVERDLAELAAKSEEAKDSALSDNADELAACADPPEMESSRAPTPNVVLVDKISLQTRALGRRVGLSARETEVLEEFVRGRSAAVIADKLFVSRNTVKTHLRRIYEKAGVHSRQELLDIIENEAPPASIVRPNPQA
ncbi:response regulator transcription factor [Rubneribacter badeniensis]|nr:LuxR C-terminal-related transcriptional regulator [Rubneribacter badeniensis]